MSLKIAKKSQSGTGQKVQVVVVVPEGGGGGGRRGVVCRSIWKCDG